MRLLEHEAKQILKKYGIVIPQGRLIEKGDSADIDTPVIIKAQVPIGGRGKAGGILEVNSTDEARDKIDKLFNGTIRNYPVLKILLEEKANIQDEYFMAITYDTVAKEPIAIFSREGGVDVEEQAGQDPEKVNKEFFTIRRRLPQYHAREIIAQTGISGRTLPALGGVLAKLADIFLDYDATLAEINPLAMTAGGRLIALDCHMDIDDDAVFRHPDIAKLQTDVNRMETGRKSSEFEQKAAAIDSIDHRGVAGRMIEFKGNLGLIIGGGGASLTAFDAIRDHDGRPANYCEIGGNPSVRKVTELTKLVLSMPGVDKIAVIMNVVSNTRVDLVARGIIKGILEFGRDPLETVAVFRVPGSWEEEGFKILRKYGVTYCDRSISIDKAAKIAVENMKASYRAIG